MGKLTGRIGHGLGRWREGQIPDGWYCFGFFLFTASSGMVFSFNAIRILLRGVEGMVSSSMCSWRLKCHP